MKPQTAWKETAKQAIISILIGASISFLTVLFQGVISWLNSLPAAEVGTVAGISRYLYIWKSNLHA